MARMVGDESRVLSLSVIKLYKVQVILKKGDSKQAYIRPIHICFANFGRKIPQIRKLKFPATPGSPEALCNFFRGQFGN